MGTGAYFVTSCINWNEFHRITCKIDLSLPTKATTQIDRNTTEILKETRKKCKLMSKFVIIMGTVLLFCDLYDIFLLHFVENLVGVEHKYKRNPNAANIYESLLLEKYPFSCWTPFDKTSITAHLATYIYTVTPVFMMALRSGSVTCCIFGVLIYTSLQFKFVSQSLEKLNSVENSDSQIEQNTITSQDKQKMSEESNYRIFQVSATDDEVGHTPSQAQVPECSNIPKNTDTSISTAHCVKDQELKTDSGRLLSDTKSSPESCVITIIKNHQQVIL
jgi:hypothetical protein